MVEFEGPPSHAAPQQKRESVRPFHPSIHSILFHRCDMNLLDHRREEKITGLSEDKILDPEAHDRELWMVSGEW